MNLKHWLLHLTMQHARNKVKKKDSLLGQGFTVPRAGQKSVDTILYRPKKAVAQPLPVMFNVHGGAWVGGDATVLDTQSQYLADLLGCFVVNINYTKLDAMPFPYPQQEIRDAVLYFSDHAQEYGIDNARFSLIGYSAGGHLCAGTAMLLRDAGFKLNSQFLCYPFLNFMAMDAVNQGMEKKEADKVGNLMDEIFFSKMDKAMPLLSPANAPVGELVDLAPAEIITCGEDALYVHSTQYQEHLTEARVPAACKDYVGSVHGFLEVNFPETEKDGAKSSEQEALMKEAVEYIRQRAFHHWNIREE